MMIFLSIIIVVILIMVLINQLGGKKTKQGNKKRKPRLSKKIRERLNKKRMKETKALIEKFSKHPKISPDVIEQCNKVLLNFEDTCNCFVDNDKEFPTCDIEKCMTAQHSSKCKDYNECKKKMIGLMSESEPNYNPDAWSNPIIEGSHNCYSYFLDDHIPATYNKCRSMCAKKNNCKSKIKECGKLKPQPGNYAGKSGMTKFKNRTYTCKAMREKVLHDSYDKKLRSSVIRPTAFNKKCPPRHYKGALVVDRNNTYHFYRQDCNGRWSHKQGTLRVENVDASGKPIYAPHLADLDYKKDKPNGINYNDFCGYFCVPKNGYLKTNAV